MCDTCSTCLHLLLLQLDPELWARLLPALVRVMGPASPPLHPSTRAGPSTQPWAPELQSFELAARLKLPGRLLAAAKDMERRMHHTQVIRATMRLVGEPAMPAELHALVTRWAQGCWPEGAGGELYVLITWHAEGEWVRVLASRCWQ